MSNALHPVACRYRMFEHVASNLQSAVLLIIRLFFGYMLFLSGKRHLGNVPAMVQRFTEWGVPFPKFNVYVSGGTELVGGLLLMLGIAARLVSVPLVINFIVAYLTASRKKVVALFAGPDHLDAVENFFNDDAFNFLIASLVILAFGPGKVSVDYLLHRKDFRSESRGHPPA